MEIKGDNVSSLSKKQSGISAIGILCLLCIFGAVATLAIKIIPLYIENNSINQAILSASQFNFNDMTRGEIRSRINKSFSVNTLDVSVSDLEIVQKNTVTTVRYEHEERVNLFSNVDIAIRFENYFSTEDAP